jgi:plasmid stabilization system protein ParE
VPFAVRIARNAERMLQAIETRWAREHGPGAENPLLDELGHTIELLRETPELGVARRVRGRGAATERRWLLRSGWHVHYTYFPRRELVLITAVWSARRGSGPP